MKPTLIAAALIAIAVPAIAQTAGAPPPPPPPVAVTPPPGPPAARPPHGPGAAMIRLKGPSGSEISVRCADGESTRACAEVIGELIEKARGLSGSMTPGDGRRDREDRDGDRRYRDRY